MGGHTLAGFKLANLHSKNSLAIAAQSTARAAKPVKEMVQNLVLRPCGYQYLSSFEANLGVSE